MTAALKLVVAGVSGCGRQTLDVIDAINASVVRPLWEVVGVVDDAPSLLNLERLAQRNVPYLGTLAAWLIHAPSHYYTVGIGDPTARRHVAGLFDSAGHRAARLIDPRAVIGTLAQIGEGVVIRAGAQLCTNVQLGRHVYVNFGVIIGHDTVCEDYVSLNPGAILSGECKVEERSLIGAGAVVLQQLKVGKKAVVGASACVTKSVPDNQVVIGVPAR